MCIRDRITVDGFGVAVKAHNPAEGIGAQLRADAFGGHLAINNRIGESVREIDG